MKISIAIACALALAAPAATQPSAPASTGYGPPIGTAEAMAIVRRAIENSTAKGFRMAIAVVEPSGELVAFARMDDAPYASIRLSQTKARTAARLRLATAELEERVLKGRVVLLSSDEVIAIGGGMPIVANGRIIGAIGVSGATAAEDAMIASTTLAAP